MPSDPNPPSASPSSPEPARATESAPRLDRWQRLRLFLLGPPKELHDREQFAHMGLVPFLAWVGLGADGLSSSSYGPEEAFLTLGEHTYMAVGLALLTASTVLLISHAYSRIIDDFPHGGGGYVVATALLGERVGVISGCALLVDYVLTVTVSIAAAGDALYSFMPEHLHGTKLLFELLAVVVLTGINSRGARESVMSLMPVFVLFLLTHIAVIGFGILLKAPQLPQTFEHVGTGFRSGLSTLGLLGMLRIFVHAYSLGGGTYTGIEAVSNGLAMMREPRVQTAKRTMVYMAISLAAMASGLLLCYLLWQVKPVPGQTLNAVLIGQMVQGLPFSHSMLVITLLAEGALLIVAAQAGFLDGPRVLANMAVDSWMPRRFAALSERLTAQNGIFLMGGASLLALFYTGGEVRYLVVMYSINVFLTFSLSMYGMLRATWKRRREHKDWLSRTVLFGTSFLFCFTILLITVVEKFADGGWITLIITGAVVALCYSIRNHYRETGKKLAMLHDELRAIPLPAKVGDAPLALRPELPTAVVLVSGFGGVGIHTFLNVFRTFPGHFKNVIFVSVGVIDSGEFKGVDSVEALERRTQCMLDQYVEMAARLRVPAIGRFRVGTDAIFESEKICRQVAREFPHVAFFAGKVVFEHERWYHAVLHNESAFAIQKRLQWAGLTMAILPARVH